jgi:hypothetical protein
MRLKAVVVAALLFTGLPPAQNAGSIKVFETATCQVANQTCSRDR